MKRFTVGLANGGTLDIDADVWAEKGSFVIFGDLVGTGKEQSVREHTMVKASTVELITVDAGLAKAVNTKVN